MLKSRHKLMKREAGTMAGVAVGVALILILVWGGLLPPVAPAFANTSGSVQVSINAPLEVTSGGNFTGTVSISQVANFDAANYDVSFDPTVFRLDGITNGNIGGTVIPVDIFREGSPGLVTIVQNVPGISGVSGSGYLAVLLLGVVGSLSAGSNISLSNGVLSSNLAQEIPATWTGVLVQVALVEAGGQGLPPAPALPPEATTTEAGAITTEPEATVTELEVTPSESEVGTEKEELPPPSSQPPESETTSALAVAPASSSPPPPALQTKPVNWLLLGGVIGGVVIVIGLIIFFQVRMRSY